MKVMIGGAPVSQAYADEIGADGYARDSTLAVVRAKELLGVPVDALMATRARGWEIVERVRAGERLVFDGGYGTALFAAGLAERRLPGALERHARGRRARASTRATSTPARDLVETNTFGGTRAQAQRVRSIGDSHARAEREGRAAGARGLPARRLRGGLHRADQPPAARLRRSATRHRRGVLRDVPGAGRGAGRGRRGLFAVETMMFPQEASAAIRACKAVADLPVMATMFFQYEELHDRDRTMWGESPAEVAKSLLAAGADVVGMNCGRGPDRAIVIIREMRAVTDAPLIAYPNAGLPITTGGRDHATSSAPRRWPRTTRRCSTPAATSSGGCCGSSPEHIRLIAEVVRSRRAR